MRRLVVLVSFLVVAAVLPSGAGAGGTWCCWKMTVKAKGTFGVGYEPRVSTDPSDRAHHVFGDALGRYDVRWKWESRGLYSYRELRDGRRRVPVLDALGSGRGFALATTARGEVHSFEQYCLVEHDRDVVDGEVVTVGERCEEPPINPCSIDQVADWTPGGASSGARLHGGDPGDKRTFLGVWVQGLFPYDGKCVQFGNISHGTAFGASHGISGPFDYVLLAPRKIEAKLRGRRSFSFAPRPRDYRAFRGDRHRISGVHPRAGEDDGEQPHEFGGSTSVKVKFAYFPMSKLGRERKQLPRAGGCGKPTLRAIPKTVERGERVTFKGACFKPRKTVTFFIGRPGTDAGGKAATARANARGAFTKRYRTFAKADPGPYVVIACQRGCRIKAQTRIELT